LDYVVGRSNELSEHLQNHILKLKKLLKLKDEGKGISNLFHSAEVGLLD